MLMLVTPGEPVNMTTFLGYCLGDDDILHNLENAQYISVAIDIRSTYIKRDQVCSLSISFDAFGRHLLMEKKK